MKHPQIRAAILNALQDKHSDPDSVVWFDGRPGDFPADSLPAVAVYLTDAQYDADFLDGDSWFAVLHVEVFLGASATDTELDEWMESEIYPALEIVPGLSELITAITPQGYDYQRDAEFNVWASADLKYSIQYER